MYVFRRENSIFLRHDDNFCYNRGYMQYHLEGLGKLKKSRYILAAEEFSLVGGVGSNLALSQLRRARGLMNSRVKRREGKKNNRERVRERKNDATLNARYFADGISYSSSFEGEV